MGAEGQGLFYIRFLGAHHLSPQNVQLHQGGKGGERHGGEAEHEEQGRGKGARGLGGGQGLARGVSITSAHNLMLDYNK